MDLDKAIKMIGEKEMKIIELNEKIAQIEEETDKIILEKTDVINELQEEVKDQTAWANTYFKELQKAKSKIEQLQQELMVCKEDVGMLMREKKEKESQ